LEFRLKIEGVYSIDRYNYALMCLLANGWDFQNSIIQHGCSVESVE